MFMTVTCFNKMDGRRCQFNLLYLYTFCCDQANSQLKKNTKLSSLLQQEDESKSLKVFVTSFQTNFVDEIFVPGHMPLINLIYFLEAIFIVSSQLAKQT